MTVKKQTRRKDNPPPGGWVLYDGECRLCIDLANRFRRILEKNGFHLEPLQSETGRSLLAGRDESDLLSEMALVTRDGAAYGGADAVIHLAGSIRWARPLTLLVRLPGGMRLARALYRWVAANRHCYGGACGPRRPAAPVFLLAMSAITLPAVAIGFTRHAEPWVAMWIIAASLFFACKLLTLARHREPGRNLKWRIAYLFLWPGMDPRPFTRRRPNPRLARPKVREYLNPNGGFAVPAIELACGIGLVWLAAPFLETLSSYAAAWTGMVGIILILHFGLFRLLALLWQTAGVPVRPLMRAPLAATSLAGFWGDRWNRAFSDLSRDLVYRPFWRRLGPAQCTLLVFLASGLVHELVISLPAGAGWGLPTAYFLIQGFGILLERSRAGRRAGLGSGIRGRIFTLALLAAPLFWLFHPPFIEEVAIPFLQAIRSL